MKLIDYTAKTPEENLALDEVLLLEAERGHIDPVLRFWESSDYFVALGRACKHEGEINKSSCDKDGVKVLRRISGGGTVLQGPGCLNYSLILPYGEDPSYLNINGSYEILLSQVLRAISHSERRKESQMYLPAQDGLSDLVSGGLKFSGNAQARKKNHFLHHGTILYNFDIRKIPLYLKHPPQEPEYRNRREHRDFVRNIDITIDTFKKTLAEAFHVEGAIEIKEDLRKETNDLAKAKYSSISWNLSL